MADNYRIDVVSDKKTVFEMTVRLAFESANWNETNLPLRAKHWVVKDGSMVLLRWKSEPDSKVQDLPMELGVETAIAFLWEWLSQQKYSPEPDQDGSNKKGFWITTTDAKDYSETNIWFRPGGFHGGILRLTPEWCMYGK